MSNELREQWLRDMTNELRPYFASSGFEIPQVVRVSVGWPAKGGATGKSLGECWDPQCSADAAPHIFVKPTLNESEVGECLVHELLHAVMFCRYPAGESLRERLNELGKKLGPYPHAVLTPRLKEKKERKGWSLVCECTPRRVLKGSKDTVEGPAVTCAGCGKVMIVERTGGEDEPDESKDDPDQMKIFPESGDEGGE